MAQRYEKQCVDCGLLCIGNACRYDRVRILECDECGDEVNRLYRVDDGEYCENCVLERLEVIE